MLDAAAPLTAGTRTTESAYGMNAGKSKRGTRTPEIIPYNEVAATAVIPDMDNARKKMIGSRNHVECSE